MIRPFLMSTHTPLEYENMENGKVVDLDNMPEPVPVSDLAAHTDHPAVVE